MATRCRLLPTDPTTGRPSIAVPCCRVADHAGECHRHFSGVLPGTLPPHRFVMRATGALIVCADGLQLDGGSE